MEINFHTVALIQKMKIFAIIHIFSAWVIENVFSAFHNRCFMLAQLKLQAYKNHCLFEHTKQNNYEVCDSSGRNISC